MSASVESKSSLWIIGVCVFATILIYLSVVTYGRLSASPFQIFHSEVTKPEIILFSKENILNEVSNEGNIKFVAIVTNDESIKILMPKLVAPSIEHSSFEEFVLQYASGSSLAYAGHCPTTKYRHSCSGPIYDGGVLVSEKTCSCVLP